MADATDFYAVLAFLTAPAGVLWWATMVSDYYRNFHEKEPRWVELSPGLRQVIVYATYIIPPAAAYTLVQLPGIAAAVAPHYAFATAMFLGALAMKGYYELKGPAVAG